jgi:hypothetical protein
VLNLQKHRIQEQKLQRGLHFMHSLFPWFLEWRNLGIHKPTLRFPQQALMRQALADDAIRVFALRLLEARAVQRGKHCDPEDS